MSKKLFNKSARLLLLLYAILNLLKILRQILCRVLYLFKVLKNFRGGVEALIALDTSIRKGKTQFGASFYGRLSLALAGALKRLGINFSFYRFMNGYLHLCGKFPNLNIVNGCIGNTDPRVIYTFGLFQEMFQTFPQEFIGKKLDIHFSTGDGTGLSLAEFLNLPYIFSYNTTYSMQDRVIAFPDFNSCYDETKYPYRDRLPSKCKKVASESWQDNRIFWRGSLFVSFSRQCLFELGKKYPQYLKIEDSSDPSGQYVPMFEQAKYKYLIDTRGNGWSGRLQTLLQLGRVVFIADRPFREWYFNRLIPMKHFVPVAEDMSDLIEKYQFMESHPEIYDRIVANLKEFVEENLNPRRILFDAKELILKYGVVQKN